jgi:hypothetical protein
LPGAVPRSAAFQSSERTEVLPPSPTFLVEADPFSSAKPTRGP